MERNRIKTSLRSTAALILAAGLLAAEAHAIEADDIEEIVVRGPSKSTVATAAAKAGLEQNMSTYVDALNAAQRARIDASLANGRGKEIRIAAARVPTRG